MFKRARSLLMSVSLLALSTAAFAANDKVALIVGNGAYQNQSPLANPTNDAEDVAALLRSLGFTVIEGRDLSKRDLERKLKEFRQKLEEMNTAVGDDPEASPPVALFYYSGHGIQVSGRNFVVPVDAKIDKQGDVDFEAVDMEAILRAMAGSEWASIVVLDACRDNPYARSLARSMKGGATRGGESAFAGLAEMKAQNGSFIIYATDPGNVALDGDGRNSPFTTAFLKNAPKPGIDLSRMMIHIRYDVMRATGDKQNPRDTSSLMRPVFLGGAPAPLVQNAALQSDGPRLGATTRPAPPRDLAPNPIQPRAPAQPAPPATPRVTVDPNSPTEICDRAASDQEDPLRNKAVPFQRVVNADVAIPACEAAMAANPKVLRYANQLGRAYITAKRHEDAAKLFAALADKGSAYANGEMGFLSFRGWGGIAKDYAQARRWFEKAAAMGVKMSISNLAYMTAHGIGGPRDGDKAVQLYNRGIALDHAASITGLGDLYDLGLGVAKDPARARELYQKAAAMDDPDAMNALGFFAQRGKAGPIDFEEGRRWFEQAAAYDSANGMYNLGYLYYVGTGGVPKDYKIAREWFQRAAKLRHGQAFVALSVMYRNGLGVEKDMAKSKELLEEAASHDDMVAMRFLAENYLDGSYGAVDRDKAKAWLSRAAELDDEQAREELANFDRKETPGEACDRLASIKEDRLRNEKAKPVENVDTAKAIPACQQALAASPAVVRYANQLGIAYITDSKYAEAMKVLMPAAEKKSAYAALWIGNFHKRGLGVAVNLPEAAKWYERAGGMGSVNAQFNLGLMHKEADGIPRNLVKARELFEKAAAAGEPSSMTELGHMYLTGQGVPLDQAKARKYYETAANLGNRIAMHQLGEIYRLGQGIAIDARTARLWYGRAASEGYTGAMRALATLYISGAGGEKEMAKARGLLQQAAGENDTAAMNMLAQGSLAGTFDEVNEAEARLWYEKSAALGNATARRWLSTEQEKTADPAKQADLCDQLAGIAEDPLRAVRHPPARTVDHQRAIPACEGAVKAFPEVLRHQNQLGRAYIAASRHFDALRVYKGAAEAGAAHATLWVGNIYSRGLGVPKNLKEAQAWYEKAAEMGSIVAMYNLAMHYSDEARRGVDKERSAGLALKWFEAAAALGMPDAMYILAKSYEHGSFTPKDAARQVDWLRKASEFTYGDAQNDLAMLYFTGKGVAKDEKRARELFRKAIDNGTQSARQNLAHMLIFGYGGPVDKAEAKKLLEQAVSANHTGSIVYYGQAQDAGMFGKVDKSAVRALYSRAADLGDAKAKRLLAELK